jgi:hypothetical protein
MKSFCTFVFFMCFGTIVSAQNEAEIPRQKFFTTTIGLTWQTRKDNLFSPLTFSGYGAELHLGSERISEKWFKQFDLWGNINEIKSRVDKGYNSVAYGFRYGISQTWAKRILPQRHGFRWYVGGGVFHTSSMGYYQNNVNNLFSYNVPTGISASSFLTRDFRLFKRNWLLSTQLTVPILAYNARPNYLGFVNEENFTQDFGIVTVNKLLHLDWKWQIDLPLSNGNRLRAIYRWDYMDDKHNVRLQVGTQTLLIQSLFQIPYKKKKNEQ